MIGRDDLARSFREHEIDDMNFGTRNDEATPTNPEDRAAICVPSAEKVISPEKPINANDFPPSISM
ncbi:hypothetical protein OE766_25340 [Pararhizobium sp. YC-54]|uniref:hypothetical protein n=1 Tax=Pararhizobium sp. YC-54 TaxID=2986920 RepID=UPI0021F7CEF7|nr:hypothetical protein [Pararhizobium sp. YC-54]MCW0001548.1 hypothetical protein [Pararhizobium sp. YC-54]